MKKIMAILLIGLSFSLFIGLAIFLRPWMIITLFIALLFVVTNLVWTLLPFGIRSSLSKKKASSIGLIFILFIWSLLSIALKNQRYIISTSIEQLKSLPYLTWVQSEKNLEKRRVTKYNRTLAYEGFNIYTDDSPTAYLIDMSGKILYTWRTGTNRWDYVEMCDNGDLLAISFENGLIRLDWNSNVKWEKKMFAHHDIAVAENQDIYTLAQKEEVVFYRGLPVPIINDYITVLSADGKIKKELSLYKILKKETPPVKIAEAYRWWWKERRSKFASWKMALSSLKGMLKLALRKLIYMKGDLASISYLSYYYDDLFHPNTVKIINRDIKGLCKEGDILICARNLNLIGIVDINNEKLIWSWGQGDLDAPHHPTLLENGNILIFDNGATRGYSRIVELNPLTKNIVWEYKVDPPSQFFSEDRGSIQRLPNGNTLITESYAGRIFEITPGKEIVWEFYSPEVNMETKKRRAIYRMVRIIGTERYPFLKKLK